MWTDARVEILKDSWRDGLSASQIAEKLGEITRNAVIGKVHRLGLAGRSAGSKPDQRRTPRAPRDTIFLRPKPRKLPYAAVTPIPDAAPAALKLSIQKLTPRTCHWPVGDPLDADFGFCGCGIQERTVYCSYHDAVAHGRAA